jgi:hypothetical protein
MIHVDATAPVAQVEKNLAYALLADGRSEYVFQVSSYGLDPDGNSYLIGSVYYEDAVGQQVEVSRLITACCDNAPAIGATQSYWRDPSNPAAPVVIGQPNSAGGVGFTNLDGSPFVGNASVLEPIVGTYGNNPVSVKPKVKYVDATINIGPSQQWDIEAMKAILPAGATIAGVSLSGIVPIGKGSVVVENLVTAITGQASVFDRSFTKQNIVNAEDDIVTGPLRVTTQGMARGWIGISVRFPMEQDIPALPATVPSDVAKVDPEVVVTPGADSEKGLVM